MKTSAVIDQLKRRFPNEPEYYQAVQEVLESIEDVYNEHPEFEKANLIERLVIPDKIHYQQCDVGNGNIMMVSNEVYNEFGEFCDYYTHGIADYDYTLQASRAGFPVLAAPDYLGECTNDHGPNWVPQTSAIKERITYLYSPKGLAYKEYLHYIKKYFPKKYYSAKIKLWLKTLFPVFWSCFK